MNRAHIRVAAASTGTVAACGALVICLLCPAAVAQMGPEPCGEPNAFGYVSPTPNSVLCSVSPTGENIAPGGNSPTPFQSMCWRGVANLQLACESTTLGPWQGFGLNLDLFVGPAMGTYPPVTLDIAQSTSPLLAREVEHFPGPVPYATRPMIQNVVDVITGVPLLREVDLELPFGGAVYRHIRTYGEPPSGTVEQTCRMAELIQQSEWSGCNRHAAAVYWDWNGQGWMVGANPILLIDSRYLGMDEDRERPRCYFMPDAHTSIPFRMIPNPVDPSKPRYVAPASLDAILDYENDGVWNPTEGEWTTRPSKWYVWLNHRAVKYTIDPHYEDLGWYHDEGPPERDVSLHEAPGPTLTHVGALGYGAGLPYYGFVKEIADRHGNRIVIEHTDFKQYGCGHGEGCQYCCQNCSEKGQVRAVKLYAAGASTATWTLVFVHRAFQGDVDYLPFGVEYDRHRQQAVQTLYVYEADIPLTAIPASLTIPHSRFKQVAVDQNWYAQPGYPVQKTRAQLQDALAALDAVSAVTEFPVFASDPTLKNWKYEVRYLYTDATPIFSDHPSMNINSIDYDAAHLFGVNAGDPGESPRLLKATIRQRNNAPGSTTPPAITGHTLYRHRAYPYNNLASNVLDTTSLKAVWDKGSLEAVHDGLEHGGQPFAGILEGWPVGLLTLKDGYQVPIPNTWADVDAAAEPPYSLRPFLDTADLTFGKWEEQPYGEQLPTYGSYYWDYPNYSAFACEMITEYLKPPLGSNWNRLLSVPTGAFVTIDRRTAGTNPRVFKTYRFLMQPQNHLYIGGINADMPGCAASGMRIGFRYLEVLRAAMHHPFLWQGFSSISFGPSAPRLPKDESVWMTVVDEYGDPESLKVDQYDELPTIAAMRALDPDDPRIPVSRRVVHMNAAGHVLKERVWDIKTGQTTQASGVLEEYRYDAPGRITEKRTVSWGAADLRDATAVPPGSTTFGADDGLIHVYEYRDPPSATEDDEFSRDVAAEGVKRGANGATYYTKQYFRNGDRPDLVECEVVFTKPKAGPLTWTPPQTSGPDFDLVLASYSLIGPAGCEPFEKTVTQSTTYRAEAATAPGGSLLHPFETEFFDPQGKKVWRAYGLAEDPFNPAGENDHVRLDHWSYDYSGRVEHQVLDALPGAGVANPYMQHELQSSYVIPTTSPVARHPTTPAALNYVTRTEYAWWGPHKVSHADGRVEIKEYQQLIDPEMWNILHLIEHFGFEPSGSFFAMGQVQHYEQGQLEKMLNVMWLVQQGQLPAIGTIDSTIIPGYDSSGQMTSTKVEGNRNESIQATIDRDAFGEVAREKAPDGTITRIVCNQRGWPERTYVGTKDLHETWGTAPPGGPFNDDLILVEKKYYGSGLETYEFFGALSGFGHTHQPIEIRKYRQRPGNQYPTNTQVSYENDVGWAEVHRYDWRARDVWVTHYSEGPTPISTSDYRGNHGPVSTFGGLDTLSHTLTYYDNLDRVRFVAVYNGAAPPPASWPGDPTKALPSHDVPTAAQVLGAAGSGIRRLTEKTYNHRGQAEKTIEYDVAVTDGSAFTLSETYYDHSDKPVYVREPNGGVRRFVYDARGRQVSGITLARSPSSGQLWEMSRTDTEYNPLGQAIVVKHWERRHDGVGANPVVLASDNAVRTFTYNWFDEDGRAWATVEFGTNTPSNAYVFNSTEPSNRPDGAQSKKPWFFIHYDYNSGHLTRKTVGDPTWPADWPADVKITAHHYVNTRRERTLFPDGSATAYRYTSLGQLLTVIENVQDPDPEKMRVVAHKYDPLTSKLVKIAAVLPGNTPLPPPPPVTDPLWDVEWDKTDGTLQVTQIVYGATVDAGIDPVTQQPVTSKNGAWIGAVHFPDPVTGQPAGNPGLPTAQPDLSFVYYPDGLLRKRTDKRGVAFTHEFDELGNRTNTTIDDSAWPFLVAPQDVVKSIDFEYDPATSEMLKATAKHSGGGIVAESTFAYNSRGRLLSEAQYHGGPTGPNSGTVNYEWGFAAYSQSGSAGNNFDRLVRMLYPAKPVSGHRRDLLMTYGDAADSLDSHLNRITRITDQSAGGFGELARYRFTGKDRRIETQWGWDAVQGPAVTQEVIAGATAGYGGLDAFGRLRDLHFKYGSGPNINQSLHRYEYTYDRADQRTSAKVAQQNGSGSTFGYNNERSWLYAYDQLKRLVKADAGALATNPQTQALEVVPSSLVPNPRRETWTLDTLGNRAGTASLPGHAVQAPSLGGGPGEVHTTHTVDRRNEIDAVTVDPDGLGPTSPSSTTPLVFDVAGNVVADADYFYQYDAWNRLVSVHNRGGLTFNALGQASGTPGALVCEFSYDGLGRLARKLSPFPGYGGYWRTEHYFYDGVRRIQEVWSDPIASYSPFPSDDEESMNPTTWSEREYVYTPGFADEFVCQIDGYNRLAYVLQDANFNVMALVADDGSTIKQYTWAPYGELLSSETYGNFGFSRIGHQGLLWDRFDANILTSALEPGVKGLYQNRNRTYSPYLGRFMQADPNGTGSPLVGALARFGDDPAAPLSAFDVDAAFGDGMNRYAYAGSNPLMNTDPLGTFTLAGLLQGTLKTANLAMRAYSAYSTAQTSVNLASSILSGTATLQGIIMTLADELLGLVGGRLADDALELAGKGIRKAKNSFFAGVARACKTCIEPGTLIATDRGQVPIEHIQVGDLVLARNDVDPSGPCQLHHVHAVYANIVPALLRIGLDDGGTIALTPDHEVWTLEHGWGLAAGLAVGDRVMAEDGSARVVISLVLQHGPTVTYNLWIDHANAFYANGVLVHNCGFKLSADRIQHTLKHRDEYQKLFGVKITDEQWTELLQRTMKGKKIEWQLSGTPTIGFFARIDGNKPLFVQFWAEGDDAGKLATAFSPTGGQLQAILRAVVEQRP